VPQHTSIALAIAALSGLGPALTAAQTSSAAAEVAPPTALPDITFTATRTERRTDDVPSTVTVLPADAVRAARDIKALFRSEIDITVRAAPQRFTAAGSSLGRAGNEGINIRGLEGNQVLMLVDGVRVPNAFSFGAFATGRGDFLALDAAQSIEVLRGPASTQFGSDGLAGAVSLRTLDPADLLRDGRDRAGFLRLGLAGVDESTAATVAAAMRSGAWQALALIGSRRSHELDNQGVNDAADSTRTVPNPLDAERGSLLAKLHWQAARAHRFGVTLEALRQRQRTEVLSARAAPPPAPAPLPATAVLDLDARDRIERERISFEHAFDDLNAAWMQKAQTRVYLQDALVRQVSIEDRNTAADRTRDNRYRQRIAGVSTQFESSFTAPLTQRLAWGVDASRSRIDGSRDGTVPPAGETFPVKPFPDTTYTLLGAFVQSEIEAGAFSVIPALRHDRYRLEPSSRGYTEPVASLSDAATTPRLGVVWRLAEVFAPYLQLARGFRAPTPDQVNNGFTNVTQGYRSIGNPDLKPERAESIEAGVRGQLGGLRWSLVGYDNRYDDFISQQVVGGTGVPGVDPLIFQFINLDGARIRGVELRAQWRIDARWTVTAGSALSRGSTERNGVRVPLDTVEPLRSVLGAQWRSGAWELRAQALHAQGKQRGRIAPAQALPFAPPSYEVLDLGVSWQPLPALSLDLDVENALDKTYWRWSDVRGLADSSTVKDAFTAPGRHWRVALRYSF
jgi:hemoglobin/transferrin/lactoferrin receptor protein